MVCRKTSRLLLRLSVNGLLMTNEQGQHFWTLQRSRSHTGQLDNSAAERNASVKRCRGPEDASAPTMAASTTSPGSSITTNDITPPAGK